MNELDVVKQLLALGPVGIGVALLYFAHNKFQAKQTETETRTYVEMSKRIDALEVAVRECDKDRRELREQFISSLQTHEKNDSHRQH